MTTRTDTQARSARGPRFDPAEYEQRWRDRWEADGLYRADNPFLAKLEDSYKVLALRMRESQCDTCHVPNNPNKS